MNYYIIWQDSKWEIIRKNDSFGEKWIICKKGDYEISSIYKWDCYFFLNCSVGGFRFWTNINNIPKKVLKKFEHYWKIRKLL